MENTTSNMAESGVSSLNESRAESHTASNSNSSSNYTFPDGKLKKVMHDSSKTPLVLVVFGAFSPLTYLHLRMCEMVNDHVKRETDFEVVGEYLSPVADAYNKKGLASAKHRSVVADI